MALKAVVKTLEGLSEEVAAEYVEKDGVYVLDLDGVDNHPAVAGLSNALKTERTERKEFEKKFKSLEGKISGLDLDRLKEIDPDDYASKLELLKKYEKEAEKQKTQKLKDEKNWEKLESQLKEQHQNEVNSLQEQFDSEKQSLTDQIAQITKAGETQKGEMQTSLIKHIKNGDLKAEIAKAKGNITILMPHMSPLVDVRANDKGKYSSVVLDDKGNPRTNNLGQPMSIKELVTEFREKPEFSGAGIFEKAKKPGGSGSQGGTGDEDVTKNPFKKGADWNLTEQAKLFKKDPQLAQQLKDEAASAGEE